MDTRSGGYNTTANFTDQDDGLRKAVSGVQGEDRATLNFPASFTADFAIAFDQSFGGIWELVENGSHIFKNSVNLSPTGTTTSPTYTFSLLKADIGSPSSFNFIVTYASLTGYRSNEFIGDAGPDANPQNSAYTATTTAVYASPLAIGFSSIAAQLNNHSVRISWRTIDEEPGGNFEVERSGNGTDFTVIGSVAPAKLPSYFFEDNSPLNGNNYYRIDHTGPDGKKTYSKTVQISAPSREALKAFVSGNTLKVTLDLSQKAVYKIALINAAGQAVFAKNIHYDGFSNSFDLTPAKTLSPGIYSVLVKGNNMSLSAQVMIK